MFRPVQFGKYYLTDRLAVGGMAEIFKAKMYGVSGFEKPMVVKQILPQYARNGEFIKMFIDEAKIAVSLTHGNIIPVFELGRCEGIYFIAMEYVHGKNLAEILEEAALLQMPMPAELALYVAIEICKGLDYAHRRTDAEDEPLGVVHRDVSPPNVMLTFTGEVKLADFGIAKAQHKLGSTGAGVVKGTYGYMSPEQLKGGDVDHRTDIFSAGILLHEMLTNQRLFSGGTDLEAIERVKQARVPAPSALTAEAPLEIDPIVIKALAKSPEDRYQAASELQLELSRALYAAGSGASAASLALYMRSLFPQAVLGGETGDGDGRSEVLAQQQPAKVGAAAPASAPSKPNNSTRSYAVRDLVDDEDLPPTAPRRRPPARQVGPAVGGATMAMPGLTDGPIPKEGLVPLEVPDAPGLEEQDMEKTAVFRRKEPAKPEVPELRFSAKSGLHRHQQPLFGSPSHEATDEDVGAALAAIDGGQPPEDEAAAERSAAPRCANGAAADQRTSTPADAAAAAVLPPTSHAPETGGGESGLMALLGRPATDEQPAVGQGAVSQGAAAQRAPRVAPPPTDGVPAVSRTRRPPSSALSATMRLFIQGLEEEEPEGPSDAPRDPTLSGLTGMEDAIPRTIKPTTLGWILILVLVAGAALFVVYKKTTLFGGGEDDVASTLDDDIKLTPPDAGPKKPTLSDLVITTQPPGAHVMLHLGEAPTKTPPLDTGRQYVLRVEREGYRTAHKVVKPEDFKGDDAGVTKADVQVTIAPAGAGGEDAPPEPEAGEPSGKKATVEIRTDPPAASVWLLIGKGRATLPQVEAKRYYFKALLAGHEPAYLTVVAGDFDKVDGSLERAIKLDATADAGAAATESKADAPADPPQAKVQPAATAKRTTRPRATKPRATKPRPTKRRRSRKARRTHKPAKAPPKKKPKKKSGLAVPNWAR